MLLLTLLTYVGMYLPQVRICCLTLAGETSGPHSGQDVVLEGML